MYIPPAFKEEDMTKVRDFITGNSFGIIVSTLDKKIHASHLPFIIDTKEEKNLVLQAHLAKQNEQLKDLLLQEEVLIIFPGPHSYVSSSWYSHENVPTWNYIAVHIYGRPEMMEQEQLYQYLNDLMLKYEDEKGVKLEEINPKMIEGYMKEITGISITATQVEAAFKLSQNRNEKDYQNIIEHLKNAGGASAAIADAMSKRVRKKQK